MFETLAVRITGVPAYATLSAGTKQPDGSWVLAPGQLAGLTVRFAHEGSATLTVTGTATEQKTGTQATTTLTVGLTAANVDSFAVNAGAVSGLERRSLSFPIGITESTPDIYEVLSVTVTGVPAYATLSAGTKQPDGSWVLTPAQLSGLTLRTAHEGGATLGVTITARDRDSGRLETRTQSVTMTTQNVDFTVAGVATGGELVRLYAPDGSLMRSLDPFPGFTGGVHVASGDVNGDGVPDVVTGAGAGGGPHVKVFDGATGAELMSFFAYDPTFAGGVSVAAGDVDGDGYADVITGAGAGGGPHVKVFSGRTGAELASFFAYDLGFTGGVSVAAADLNGDGRADVVTGAGAGGGPHVKAFDGKTGAELMSFFAYAPTFVGGVNVAAGDLTGDGFADVITGSGPGGGPHVKAFDGKSGQEVRSFFAYDPAFTGGVSVAAHEFDGDGLDDFVTGAGPGGAPHVKVFRGLTLNEWLSFYALASDFTGGVNVG